MSKHYLNMGYGYIHPNCKVWCEDNAVKKPNTLYFDGSNHYKENVMLPTGSPSTVCQPTDQMTKVAGVLSPLELVYDTDTIATGSTANIVTLSDVFSIPVGSELMIG